MSLHKKLALNKETPKENVTKNEVNLKLSQQELEVLLSLIANSSFQGKDLDTIYKLAVKLQLMLNNSK